MKKFVCSVSLMLANAVFAANVAVIDSGLDYKHEGLRDLVWTNVEEVAGNRIDDDANGYIDDIRGWNFANNHSILIEYDDEQFYRNDIAKFLDIQARSMLGTTTKGEQLWARAILKDSEFVNSIEQFP